jgi:hypothetical protein
MSWFCSLGRGSEAARRCGLRVYLRRWRRDEVVVAGCSGAKKVGDARERWGFRPDAWMGLFIHSPPGDLRPISRFDSSFFFSWFVFSLLLFCYPVWFMNLFFLLSVLFKAVKG